MAVRDALPQAAAGWPLPAARARGYRRSSACRSNALALFTKRYHEPGTLPGTLVETVCEAPLRITLVEFTDDTFEER
jgi:hypothetical protein